ncbi:MAG: hypothetical protein Q9224_005442 [Gallowayella concinna]
MIFGVLAYTDSIRPAIEHINIAADHPVKNNEFAGDRSPRMIKENYERIVKLLPQLPRLKSIRILPGPDVSAYLIREIDEFPLQMDLDSDCRRGTSYFEALMTKTRCLRKIEVRPVFDRDEPRLAMRLLAKQKLSSFRFTSDQRWPYDMTCPTKVHLKEVFIDSATTPHLEQAKLFFDGFLKLEVLRVLSLRGIELIASVLENLRGRTPNLKVIRLNASLDGSDEDPIILSEHQYKHIRAFLSLPGLEEIGLYNFIQEFPWSDLLSVSAPTLRQLTTHLKPWLWKPRWANRISSSTGHHHLQVKKVFDTSLVELQDIGAICPLIVRLGIDTSKLNMAKAVSKKFPLSVCQLCEFSNLN